MSIYNLGSIADEIYDEIEDIPTYISGTPMIKIIDRQRIFMETRTGDSIGSTAIAEKFQPAMTTLSAAGIVKRMEATGADVDSMRLGEFSFKKGIESNLTSVSAGIKKEGMEMLIELGVPLMVVKANG